MLIYEGIRIEDNVNGTKFFKAKNPPSNQK